MVRTLKDSFESTLPTDRKRTENVFTLSVLFSLQALHLWTQMRLLNCRYAVALLGSIYLPSANSICFASQKLDMI